MENSRIEKVRFASNMCARYGLSLGEYSPWPDHPSDGFLVAGFGAGIVMAAADHLDRWYRTMPILTLDLPGAMPFENRCLVIDYLTNAFPTLLLLSSSIRPLKDYIDFLESRAWNPPTTWVYLSGLGVESKPLWEKSGARVIESVWRDAPLGNLTPIQILRPWELIERETQPAQSSLAL